MRYLITTFLFILGCTAVTISAQSAQAVKTCTKDCVTIVARNRPLGEVVKTLMKEYQLVLGFEESINDRSHFDYNFPIFFPQKIESGPRTVGALSISVSAERVYVAKDNLISLDVHESEMDEVIGSIVAQMKNYSWSCDDGVYNIFPIKGRDPRHASLLELNVKHFTLKSTSMLGEIQWDLFALPEVKSFLRDHLLEAPNSRTGVSVDDLRRPLQAVVDESDVTLRQLLNRIAKVKGGGWILKKGSTRAGIDAEFLELDI